MNPLTELTLRECERSTRRLFLQSGLAGLGTLWLGQQQAAASAAVAPDPANPFAPRAPQLAAKAKRVIFLHMSGAASQFELWDHKPELAKHHGKPCPAELLAGQRFAFLRGTPLIQGPAFPFHQEEKTGKWVSDRIPWIEKVIDRLTFVHTMTTDQFNHAPAQLLVHTGTPRFGNASIGAWTTYGLGTENQNLPGFVVLLSGGRTTDAGQAAWGSGFLPSVYQGVHCRSVGEPVLFLDNPKGIDTPLRQRTIEAINRVNEETHREWRDPETLTRIAQYELAGRMQLEASSAMDLGDESPETLERYGAKPGEESLANNCLLARRLAERGVRYVQLFDWGWDQHGTNEGDSIDKGMTRKSREMDRPVHALLTDLEERGMLDETLVVWASEFGRTPMAENRGGKPNPFLGRDHHAKAFTIWLAGGGVKAGYSHGETDPLGFGPTTEPVQVRDLHATLLRLLGFDHERFVYPFRGLDQRLTGVEKARVVEELIA